MEKFSPNRAQLFVRNKYTVFTMGGTVALRSVNKNFFRRATVLQLGTIIKDKTHKPLYISINIQTHLENT